MTVLEIGVTFHGPVRVARGQSANGLDDIVDRRWIPASSLKGVMRAAAALRLGLPEGAVLTAFGSPRRAGAWVWNDLRLEWEGVTTEVTSRVRITVDEQSGAASRRSLQHAEELWVRGVPVFAVERIAPPTRGEQDDALLVAAAALAVKSIGSGRRRGLGWVTLEPRVDGRPVPPAEAAAAVVAARAAGAP